MKEDPSSLKVKLSAPMQLLWYKLNMPPSNIQAKVSEMLCFLHKQKVTESWNTHFSRANLARTTYVLSDTTDLYRIPSNQSICPYLSNKLRSA